MNAITKPAALGPALPFGREMPMTPAALARWATEMDQPSVNDVAPADPAQAALVDRAAEVAEQTFDLLLALPAQTSEDVLAQLVVLVNRIRLVAESGKPAEEMKESVCALTGVLERATITLGQVAGVDVLPLGGSLFFYQSALDAAGVARPTDR